MKPKFRSFFRETPATLYLGFDQHKRASCAFLRYMPSSLPRRNCKVPLSLTSFATLAFPGCQTGRLPRFGFRGLIERSLALRPASSRNHQVILSIEGSDEFVASSAASITTGQATLPRRDFHPLKHTRIHGALTSTKFGVFGQYR